MRMTYGQAIAQDVLRPAERGFMKLTVAIKKDRKGEWRWTLKHRNGRIVGASTEGYKRKPACLKNLELVTGLSWRTP